MIQKIVVFGKGGIGKSTISSNLAAAYARSGKKVLLVGCDPKHDTTISLTGGKPIPTAVELPGFMDLRATKDQFVVKGRLGVDCVESGGPEPGIGCAGRGISRTIEILESCGLMSEGGYDVMLFDVLGDVVCGGFAAPLRLGFADKVCIVASEELMGLYAANNITRAIKNYASNNIGLCGIIANLKDPGSAGALSRNKGRLGTMERFAELIGTSILEYLPRDLAVRRAEFKHLPAVEDAPKSPFSKKVTALADRILKLDMKKIRVPDPLSDEEFHELSRADFTGERPRIRLKSRPAGPAPDIAGVAQEVRRSPDGRGREGKMPELETPDEHLEKALQAWMKAAPDKGGWKDGPHAMQWGAPEQWRNFFADRETARNYDQHVYLDAPIVGIAHEDLECHYATPFFNDGYMTYHNFKWVQRREREDRFGAGCIGLTTDIQDQDVVQGGSRKLREAMDLAISSSKGKAAILVTTTCVPTVIGDDAAGIIEQYRGKTDLPILFSSPASGQELNLLDYFFKRIKETPEFKDTKPEKGSVNLIGFPPGIGRDELLRILDRAGIRVNLLVLPRFSVKEVPEFMKAELNVFYPDPAFNPIFKKLFSDLEIKAVTPVAPYGMANTRAWLLEIARALGMEEEASRAFDDCAKEVGEVWERGLKRAKGRRLAFVADAAHIRRLADPAGMAGIPLTRMLKEMGFGIDYLVYLEGDAPEVGKAKGPHGVRWFRGPEELDGLLRDGGFDAVFSDYFFDKRITRAGKTQFSVTDIEMGVRGAARSLERLGNVANWKFYRRCAAGTGGPSSPPERHRGRASKKGEGGPERGRPPRAKRAKAAKTKGAAKKKKAARELRKGGKR